MSPEAKKVILIIFVGAESRGVCGIASDQEHADMLVGRVALEGNVYGGKFKFYQVEIDEDWPQFPWDIAGKLLNPDKPFIKPAPTGATDAP